jgi:hypothetical protein
VYLFISLNENGECMKKELKQFAAGTLLALALCGTKVASAGERGGNGGGGFVCSDDKKAVSRVYSYDLWTGEFDGVVIERKKHHLKPLKSEAPLETQVRQAIEKLKSYDSLTYKVFNDVATFVMAQINEELSRPVTALVLQDDYVPVRSPYQNEFCPNSSNEEIVPFRTIVNYDDSLEKWYQLIIQKRKSEIGESYKDIDRLYEQKRSIIYNSLWSDFLSVDQKLFNSLENDTHRAALILHEIVYKILRVLHFEINSKRSSELVALLLSDTKQELLFAKLSELNLASEGYPSYFESLSSKLLTASSAQDIELIFKKEFISKNVTYRAGDYLDVLGCGPFSLKDRHRNLMNDIKEKKLGNCLIVKALITNNDFLFEYVDQKFKPGRNISFRDGNKKMSFRSYIKDQLVKGGLFPSYEIRDLQRKLNPEIERILKRIDEKGFK